MNPQLTYVIAQHHQQDLLRAAQRAQLTAGVARPGRLGRATRTIFSLRLVRRERQSVRPATVARA